jgi:hypothetical protein
VIKPSVAKSKLIAQRSGIEFYHGKPCKNCGGTIRSTESGKCVVCNKVKL